MKLTLFHRATNAVYAHPCDSATIAVLDAADAPAGFIGAAWGEHLDPPDVLDWAVLEPVGDAVDVTLSFWGLHRDPNVSPPPETSPEEEPE